MPEFHCRVFNEKGRELKKVIEARTSDEAEKKLRKMGFGILDISLQNKKPASGKHRKEPASGKNKTTFEDTTPIWEEALSSQDLRRDGKKPASTKVKNKQETRRTRGTDRNKPATGKNGFVIDTRNWIRLIVIGLVLMAGIQVMPTSTARWIFMLSVMGLAIILRIFWFSKVRDDKTDSDEKWYTDWLEWFEASGSMTWWAVHLLAFGFCCYFYWAATIYGTLPTLSYIGMLGTKEEPIGWGQYFACYCLTGLPMWMFGISLLFSLNSSPSYAGEEDYGIVLMMPLFVGGFGFLFFGLLRVIAFFLGYE